MRRLLLIGVGVLAVIVVIGIVLTQQKTQPLAEGSRLVNINTATAAELESLPGIGPSLARLVIAGRPYADVSDLARVRGIGERQVAQLRPILTVSEPTRELRPASIHERIVAWAAALTPLSLAAYGVAALISIGFVLRLLRTLWRRWLNARTRAAFEDAERRRWEGHRRE